MCNDHGNGGGYARRRSVDVGGLALALGEEGLGHGWGGWDEDEMGEARYAELLSDMYTNAHIHTSDSPRIQPSLLQISDNDRLKLIQSLDSWHFEPHKLPDDQVLACALILFESLYRKEGMREDVGVPIHQISSFLHHLRQVYRRQNSYHNFHHALDVLQATHNFLSSSGIVPPVSILLGSDDARCWRPDTSHRRSKSSSATNNDAPPNDNDSLLSCLTNLDLFALYVAAIGHDAGHPGFTNVFMKNAKAPLSLVYDDRSALEQMHCVLLLKVMRHHGLGSLLDRPKTGAAFRRLLLQTVLATDMSVHFEFMKLFRGLLDREVSDEERRKVLICQALIKCADISNPCRPMSVSRHWAAALMEEWTNQAVLEKHLHLPPSVQPSDDPLSEAKSQVWFINMFAKPLFDISAQGVPPMARFSQQCASNLQTWETRCKELGGDSPSRHPASVRPVTPALLPEDFMNAFPLTLPTGFMIAKEPEQSDAWHAFTRKRAPSDVSSTTRSSGSGSGTDSRGSSPARFSVVLPMATALSDVSPPITPSDYSAASSSLLSPHSDASPSAAYQHHPRAASVTSVGSVGGSNSGCGNDATAAIRAAYKASVRKKKSFHRSSWNSSPSSPTVPDSPSSGHVLRGTSVVVPSLPSPLSLNSITPSATIMTRCQSSS